ncbi:MAG TPA: carboxypeptidase-like regulatory domain-containing protein, partial [Bryobacteraceae bacterium]|nr:carboxypeptidase-like regulatory domain-containing protein [Bryobacteraceae bacterium]
MKWGSLALRFLFPVFAALLGLSATTSAQYRASIQGVVTDPNGGVVSGAQVTLRNLETGQNLVAVTNDGGI